jgi:mRNA interferase HigB
MADLPPPNNRTLREFSDRHPVSASPMQAFRHLVESSNFRNFAELRATFPSVDKIGDRYVFNIGGNKFRVVAAIAFSVQTLWVKAVLTHAEYDKGGWK